MTRVVLVALLLGACQGDVHTPFPAGLEPFEDNPVAAPTDEVLRTTSRDTDMVRVYGRGLVHTDPTHLWQLAMTPEAMVARCSTDEQLITPNNDDGYVFSFLVHYIVRRVLTVEWDDQWRYGVILGSPDAVELGMIKHQKTQGSDFITVSEGTIEILATDDPAVSELAFVEHLQAVSGGVSDVLAGMQHNYDALVALAHDGAIPACP